MISFTLNLYAGYEFRVFFCQDTLVVVLVSSKFVILRYCRSTSYLQRLFESLKFASCIIKVMLLLNSLMASIPQFVYFVTVLVTVIMQTLLDFVFCSWVKNTRAFRPN